MYIGFSSLAVLLIVAALPAGAQSLSLAPVFSDHMVLQRGTKTAIWGLARPGSKVTVSLGAKSTAVTADGTGAWMARLGPYKAGGPLTLKVKSGDQVLTVSDILVGEVWLCSGQSNMQFGLSNADTGRKAIETSNIPNLRLSRGAGWSVSSPDSAKSFSAVGFFFGRALEKHLNVPVGIIENGLGGTPAEAWTSKETLVGDPFLKANYWDPWTAYVKEWEAAPEGKKPNAWMNGPEYAFAPARLFEERIRPLVPFAIKGVVWYQGESNAWAHEPAAQYYRLLPALVNDWRAHWYSPNMPFLIVQLPSWPYPGTSQPHPEEPWPWGLVQDAQERTARTLPHVGLVAIPDLGDKDIHPTKKEPVGERVALVARRMAYGEKGTIDSGPVLKSWSVRGNAVYLTFGNTAGGIVTDDGRPPAGFTIAGEDRRQVWADATIEGDTIVLTSKEVPKPVAARYGMAGNSPYNVFNKAGLPLAVFRTDEWSWDIQPREDRIAKCVRASTIPTIDGKLDDPAWTACPPAADFYVAYTYHHAAYRTEARFCTDSANLYIAIRCAEPDTDKLVAKAGGPDDEAIWHDDAVEILLDPTNSRRDYLRFVVNPAGTVAQGKGHNDSIDGPRMLNQSFINSVWFQFDKSWRSGATIKTSREKDSWTVEAEIPWSDLGGVQRPGSSLGLEVLRFHADPPEVSEWSQTGKDYTSAGLRISQSQSPKRFGKLVLEPEP